MDQLSMMIDFEEGLLSDSDILVLFSGLIRSGLAWSLQGSYGRMAARLIDNGFISNEGIILQGVN